MVSTIDNQPSPPPTTSATGTDPIWNGSSHRHHVVIVGGGFGGLYAAKALGRAPVDVTLIDKRNFHLFQPLLYQVATGAISPADIASPLRGVLARNKNTRVLLNEVTDLNPETQILMLKNGDALHYDTLIVATGVSHHYFGNDQWQTIAPGLKTVEDALEMRRRIFSAFETAEKIEDPALQKAWMTFAIVGGGPTGVELAGAIAEIAHGTLRHNFRHIDTSQAEIILIEGMDRVLPPYDPSLSASARDSLQSLGVTVRTQAMVTHIDEQGVTLKQGDTTEAIAAKTVLWAAGVKASSMGKILADRTGVELDRAGRVIVEPDLSISGQGNIFVIGDLANFPHQGDRPLPGVAPVAMQEGEYLAKAVVQRLKGETIEPFRYIDFGSLAVIGKNSAVVDLGFVKFSGPLAWLVWVFAHIYYLIEFDNKLIVMIQWGWNYVTKSRGARLITGEDARIVDPTEVPQRQPEEALTTGGR